MAWSTNTAWSHDVDEILGTHSRLLRRANIQPIAITEHSVHNAEYFPSEATLTRSIACIQIVRFWMPLGCAQHVRRPPSQSAVHSQSTGARRMRCWRADSATDVELAVAL